MSMLFNITIVNKKKFVIDTVQDNVVIIHYYII